MLLRSLALAALTTAISAQTVRLAPVADATTDQDRPAVNLGTDPELTFGKAFESQPTFRVWFTRSHVRFDLSNVNANRVPVRATFHVYQSRANAAGCLDVALHRLTQPFVEGQVTWNSQPTFDPQVESTACVGSSFDLGWKTFDVTDLVRDWLTNAAPNHGFVIKDPTERTAGAARPGFGHSREFGDATRRPYLEIEFATEIGFGCSQRALFPLIDFAGGRAAPGGSFVLRTIATIPNSPLYVIFGTSSTTWNGQPLPLSLGRFGLPCDLLVAADVIAGFPPQPDPFDLVVPLPNDPGIAGQTLWMQVFALPPQLGFETSGGLGVNIED